MAADLPTERSIDVTLHEERAVVGTQTEEVGAVRARKRIETEHVEQPYERTVEHADLDRTPAEEGDSGEVITLPDGSVSIPVFEEVLVVEKRLVVRERVVLRKTAVVEEQVVSAELRREHVDIETVGDVQVVDGGPRS